MRTLAKQKNLEVIVGMSGRLAHHAPILMKSACSTASNDLPAAQALAKDYENVSASLLDASDESALRELIASADVVLR